MTQIFIPGQHVDAFVIGVCGGSASGKTTVAKKIIKSLNIDWVTLLSMDSFYKVLSPEQHEAAARNEYNFDHPDAFDFALLGTIHILRKHFYSTKLNLITIFSQTRFLRQNKTKSISMLHFDKIFMLQFANFSMQRR